MRHIETVRNYISTVIRELSYRAEQHDQSKLQEPELTLFNDYTPKLRDTPYGSEEYKKYMKEMKIAIDHHNQTNRHHPEHFANQIQDMNLIDLLEVLCDWKAATLRHNTGDIYKSLEMNADRFNYGPELKQIMKNTIDWLQNQQVFHHGEES